MANILILSAGRRVSLVRCFQREGRQAGLGVIAADMNPSMSSACQVADSSHVLPHVLDPAFAGALRSLCEDRQVKMVIPTIDTELAVLAGLRESFARQGIAIVVSDTALIDICGDKRATAAHFAGYDIASPTIMRADQLTFPLLVKPFDGSLSIGVHILRSEHDLSDAILDSPRNMFCQFLDPQQHEEFTCDAYFDASARLRCIVPRLRVEVRGGEVAKGRTERNEIIPYLRKRLGHLPGARGCLTIQIMRHRANGSLYLIEVNPRFGGGYPLTAQSGASYHQWLIREYVLGETIADFDAWQDKLTMLRYDAEVFVGG